VSSHYPSVLSHAHFLNNLPFVLPMLPFSLPPPNIFFLASPMHATIRISPLLSSISLCPYRLASIAIMYSTVLHIISCTFSWNCSMVTDRSRTWCRYLLHAHMGAHAQAQVCVLITMLRSPFLSASLSGEGIRDSTPQQRRPSTHPGTVERPPRLPPPKLSFYPHVVASRRSSIGE